MAEGEAVDRLTWMLGGLVLGVAGTVAGVVLAAYMRVLRNL